VAFKPVQVARIGHLHGRKISNRVTMNFLEWLKQANDYGIWDLLTFFSIPSILGLMWFRSRQRVEWFSLHVSYQMGRAHPKYPNVLYFLARNLNDSPIVVSRPNFRFTDRLKASKNAHGNLATRDYEIKFRRLDPQGEVEPGFSYTTILIRHRESYLAYIPFDDAMQLDEFKQLLAAKPWFGSHSVPLGHLLFDIVEIEGGKPTVHSMRVPIRNVVEESAAYSTGKAV
jgi:hypothetical protein